VICLHSCVANSEYILLRPTKLAVKSEICRLENPQSIYRHGFRDYFCLSYVFDLIFCAPSGICVWTHRHAYEIFWPSGHRHRGHSSTAHYIFKTWIPHNKTWMTIFDTEWWWNSEYCSTRQLNLKTVHYKARLCSVNHGIWAGIRCLWKPLTCIKFRFV
jgi:hypothetical protein